MSFAKSEFFNRKKEMRIMIHVLRYPNVYLIGTNRIFRTSLKIFIILKVTQKKFVRAVKKQKNGRGKRDFFKRLLRVLR